jgi:hypothetical protein
VKTGVLTAMSQPNLTVGNFVTISGDPGTLCPSTLGAPVTDDTRHQNVQNEVVRLIGMTDEALTGDYCIRSERRASNDGTNLNRTVDVELRAKYDAFFPLLRGMPMVLSATGPYLVDGR